MERIYRRITEKEMVRTLFWLCWLVYFSTYIGRLNYSASLTEMVRTGEFTKGQAGMIGTGFFFAYGAGQFVSGFLGDKRKPGHMVFTGLAVSSVCNLVMAAASNGAAMTVIWCVNGLFQSFIWSPLIRLMFEYYQTDTRVRSCISLNSSVPIGTMAAYGLTAVMIQIRGWRSVFVLAGVFLALVSVIWLFGIRRIEGYALLNGVEEREGVSGAGDREKAGFNWKKLLFGYGFLLLMAALCVQGALKDGVTTWIPTYISETYGLGSVLSITSTMLIPVFNLMGVYLASVVNMRVFRNEVKTAAGFFVLCSAALFVLFLCSGRSLVLTFLMLAVSTTAMMAVNTMLIAVLPSYFGVMGRASTVSGLLNSSVYAGGALSTYGIGALSVALGWNYTILVWFVMAAISFLLCFLTGRKWALCRKSMLGF